MSASKVWEDGYRQALEDVENGVAVVKQPVSDGQRFQAACAALQAMLTRVPWGRSDEVDAGELAADAVLYADALLAALAEEKP